MESIKEIEKEIKTQFLTELRKKEIVVFLATKIGVNVYKKYFYSHLSDFEDGDLGNGWEIEVKIDKILNTYIERKPDIPLESYIYVSLKRFIFKEFILKSHTYIKTEKGILKCPVCKYSEYLELVNPYLRIYKCSHCEDIINSGTLDCDSEEYYKHKTFSFFTEDGVLCPNIECNKILPISALNIKEFWIDTDFASLILNGIEEDLLPDILIKTDLKCPYCSKIFKIENAELKSLATSRRYRKFHNIPVQDIVILNSDNSSIPPYQSIDAVKKSNILIEELIIKLAHLESNSFNKCLKKYLYMSQILWIKKFWNFAPDYFFYKMKEPEILYSTEKYTLDVLCPNNIHKTMFDIWLIVINNNLDELRKFKPINGIEELKWFCRMPDFSGGPIDTFITEVTENNRIKNNSKIVDLKSDKWNIRIGKVLSISKIENEEFFPIDFSENNLTTTWQDIIIKQDEKLKPGDVVSVSSIMMSGHPSHAPIRALLRVRSDILFNISSRIVEEERAKRDINFWNFRKERVKTARNITKIDIRV